MCSVAWVCCRTCGVQWRCVFFCEPTCSSGTNRKTRRELREKGEKQEKPHKPKPKPKQKKSWARFFKSCHLHSTSFQVLPFYHMENIHVKTIHWYHFFSLLEANSPNGFPLVTVQVPKEQEEEHLKQDTRSISNRFVQHHCRAAQTMTQTDARNESSKCANQQVGPRLGIKTKLLFLASPFFPDVSHCHDIVRQNNHLLTQQQLTPHLSQSGHCANVSIGKMLAPAWWSFPFKK